MIGAGVNGRAAARTFVARGRESRSGTSTPSGPRQSPRSSAPRRGVTRGGARRGPRRHGDAGPRGAPRRGLARAGPARVADGRRRAGQGGDRGRGARARPGLLRRLGAGEPRRRARARGRGGRARREDVTELGAVLAGAAHGRRHDDEATVFDSTGLAIQDLAIALAALERVDELDLPRFGSSVCRAARAGSNRSRSGSRSPRIARATSSPAREAEHVAVARVARGDPDAWVAGTGPTSGRRSRDVRRSRPSGA